MKGRGGFGHGGLQISVLADMAPGDAVFKRQSVFLDEETHPTKRNTGADSAGNRCCRRIASLTLLPRPSSLKQAERKWSNGICPVEKGEMGMFRDRIDAGRQLAEALDAYRGQSPLVLAVPRGAVPMGKLIADTLEGDFDVVLVCKIGAPLQPELAVAAIDESGWIYCTPGCGDDPELHDYLAAEAAAQLGVIRSRRAQYTPQRAPRSATGRIVIVVDDGLATGATMIAALHSLREKGAARLVCAVPVAPAETVDLIRPHADEVICLATPPWFEAVGQFYADFTQVGDDEVVATLRAAEATSSEPHSATKEKS